MDSGAGVLVALLYGDGQVCGSRTVLFRAWLACSV